MDPRFPKLHKVLRLLAVGLFLAALPACRLAGVGKDVPASLPVRAGEQYYNASHPGEVDHASNLPESQSRVSYGRDAEPLRGRATFEGGASGQFDATHTTGAFRYFLAHVSLIADFNENRIWGIVTDGRETLNDNKLFDALRLEPTPIRSEEAFSPNGGVAALIDGAAFTGDWAGRLSGSGTSILNANSFIAGTFRAQRIDDSRENLSGTFDAHYRGYTSRTVRALNELSATDTVKSLVAHSVATTASAHPVSTAAARDTHGYDNGGALWNTGVTQSSHNGDYRTDAIANWALNARYEDGHLVFDRKDFLSSALGTLTTSESEASVHRTAISLMRDSRHWKGVEHIRVDPLGFSNYSFFISDIEAVGDTNYLTGGFWISLPEPDNFGRRGLPSVTVVASGNDPFRVANIEPLRGQATYQGDAFGLHEPAGTPAFRSFDARVRLAVNFDYDIIRGVVTDGRDTATREPIFSSLVLNEAHLQTEKAAFFRKEVSGVVDGQHMRGLWGGQFFGNKVSPTDVPASIAGTFSARSNDGESLVGFFGAYENTEDTSDPGERARLGDGVAIGDTSLRFDNIDGLGGRATYGGVAAGSYTIRDTSPALRFFRARVTLTADLRDNYIWGAVTDGRDTTSLERIFERLSLEPAAIRADEASFFQMPVTGLVNHRLFSGEWGGQFFVDGASSIDQRGSVAGSFRAESVDDRGDTLTGAFQAAYQGRTSRTVTALNDLPEAMAGRLASGISRAARAFSVSSTDAEATGGSEAGSALWNTGVTQSSNNWLSFIFGKVRTNYAINARYEGQEVVFDRIDFLAGTPEKLTTGHKLNAPGYRQAISPVLGSRHWKAVEILSIDPSQHWNYSFLVSDIGDNEDTDYLAGGFSISLPDPDNPYDTRIPWFTASASGNDPFQVENIESLQGRATYEGDAGGFYASRSSIPRLRYFNADVRLAADFLSDEISGIVSEGRVTATNEVIFESLELGRATRKGGTAFFRRFY